MNYFYTEQQLGNFLESWGGIDWASYGFNTKEVSKAVQQGFQVGGITMLPIVNEAVFNERLGYLIAESPSEDGEISKIITYEQAIQKRDELQLVQQSKAEAEAASAPLTTDQKLDLLMLSQLESEGII